MVKNEKPTNRLWRFCLTRADFDAMDFIRKRYLFGSRIQTVRYALREQSKRDQLPMDNPVNLRIVPIYRRTLESCRNYLYKSHHYGVSELALRQWSGWLAEEQFVDMEVVSARWNFHARVEALRFALRVQAEIEGFRPQGGAW